MRQTLWALLLVSLAAPARAECTLRVVIHLEAEHGTLARGAPLTAELRYSVTQEMRMGAEARAYLTDGQASITAADGTGLTGRLGVIHVVRAPHWADYVSFDIAGVAGDLGGITRYGDPMLLSFFAERGALSSFALPDGPDAWAQFDQRQSFQVHTPDGSWTLLGEISAPVGSCGG